MSSHRLQLGFKGNRTYLQGPDIFNQTLGWISSIRNGIRDIDFAFYRLATHQLEAIAGQVPEGVRAVAVCTYTYREMRETVHLVETEAQITDRYPYPEDEIVEPMTFDLAERRGVLHCDGGGFSDIEIWVAMTKALHLKVLPDLRGKWLFVRGRFSEYAEHSSGERAIALTATFSEKLTRSEAYLDGRKVGDIFFSMV